MTRLTRNTSFYTREDLDDKGAFPISIETSDLAKTSKNWKIKKGARMKYDDPEISGKTHLFTVIGFDGPNGRVLWGRTKGRKTYITIDAFTHSGHLSKA